MQGCTAAERCGGRAASVASDCDDDGESAAGGRLLHLLTILDVKNVCVVVSRPAARPTHFARHPACLKNPAICRLYTLRKCAPHQWLARSRDGPGNPQRTAAGVSGPYSIRHVCGRWYGGIQLGPDRFKHINNVARSLLSACGYVSAAGDDATSSRRRR